MVRSTLRTFAVVVAGLLPGLVACGGRERPAQAPAETKIVDEKSVPQALAPNIERDRRGDAGVRAPAKPLVMGSERAIPRCGKLGGMLFGKGARAEAAPESKARPAKAAKAAKRGRGRRGSTPRGGASSGAASRGAGASSATSGAGASGAEVHDLLAGRLRVGPLPRGRALPPPKDGPTLEEESRLVIDGGGEGLAIVAKETFQLDPDRYAPEADAAPTPGSLDEEAPKFLTASFPNEEELDISPVEIGDAKLRAYAARPKEPNAPPGQDVALVLALLLAHPDGTLQSVTFHVRGEMVRNATGNALVGCTRLAERVAKTLVPGPRELDRSSGTRALIDVPGAADKSLVVRVPDDYVSVKADDVVRLYKLRPLSMYAGNIAVVVGPKRDGRPNDEGSGDAVAGKLLGRDVKWQKKTLPTGGGWLYASEPLEPGGDTFADVLVKTRQSKMLDEMQSVAETLSVATKD